MNSHTITTPIGNMIAVANNTGIYSLDFVDENTQTVKSDSPLLLRLEVELTEYFAGKRSEFSVPLAPLGTPFQMGVWETLRQISYGETVSYMIEAQILGCPTAVRAVANANGRNPISILIPCHRVIASNGTIGGYSGGVWRKEFLLKLENSVLTK